MRSVSVPSTGADGLDDAGDFVPRNEGERRRVEIHPRPREDVREVHAERANRDTHLTGSRHRVRAFPHAESLFRKAGPDDEDRLHGYDRRMRRHDDTMGVSSRTREDDQALKTRPGATIILARSAEGETKVKVAVPSDDGVRISPRFDRASSFVVADVALGEVVNRHMRVNPVGSRVREGLKSRRSRRGRERYVVVGDLIADCRAVIARFIGEKMRHAVERRGLEVVITSEPLVDRALALFSIAALQDESRINPEDEELELLPVPNTPDEFDG